MDDFYGLQEYLYLFLEFLLLLDHLFVLEVVLVLIHHLVLVHVHPELTQEVVELQQVGRHYGQHVRDDLALSVGIHEGEQELGRSFQVFRRGY